MMSDIVMMVIPALVAFVGLCLGFWIGRRS